MSKSLGNVVQPQKVIQQSGADILRLWVVSSDYYEDLRIGPEILKRQSDHYRRIRNTLRYLLGALDGFTTDEAVSAEDMPELERWVLSRLAEVDASVRAKTDTYDFHGIFTELHDFCNGDLSAFYFDIRKDMLYCDAPDDVARRSARTVMDHAFCCLTAWIAPILCFTADEAWLSYTGDETDSIHLQTYQPIPDAWADAELSQRWANIRALRSQVTSALEAARNDDVIGSSLQAAVRLHVPATEAALISGIDLESLFITSAVEVASTDAATVQVEVARADGGKCARCWKILPEITQEDSICGRCDTVVNGAA